MLPSSPSSSAILCLPFPTSVPNKVDGVQDVETLRSRMWPSDMIYCEGGTGAAILNHILIPNQKCYLSLIFISIIRSFICASLHPLLLCLHHFSFHPPPPPSLASMNSAFVLSLCLTSCSAGNSRPDCVLSCGLVPY